MKRYTQPEIRTTLFIEDMFTLSVTHGESPELDLPYEELFPSD